MTEESGSAADLTAGADPAVDEVTAAIPTDPSYREGVSIWIWDDAGRFCFPRIGVEAVGATWSESFENALAMATPDGPLLLAHSSGVPRPVADGAGRPRVLGAGPLVFTCVEPFARWRVDFDGRAVAIGVEEYLSGGVTKPRTGTGHDEVPVALSVEASMVAPPWFQGTHDPDGHHVAGEHRFEQLCEVTGTVTLDGGAATSFSGGGLRVHRKGGNRNDYGDFHGHVWQSARFGSGRAFGTIHYHPGPDGVQRYREGWVIDDGELLAAKVEDTPWLAGTDAGGEDVSFALRTVRGVTRIEGETFASSFRPPRPAGDGAHFPVLQSGIARYRWGDEEAFGMIERSARLGST